MQKHIEKLKNLFADFYILTKPGVTFMVVLTAAAGFYLGLQNALNVWLFVKTIVGTALVAGGTSALNQLLESEQDLQMKRTRRRPLPDGRLQHWQAQLFGTIISSLGLLLLFFGVNALTGFLAALTLGSYVFVYTPLKRRTTLSTLIGAIPGALPPMGGWAAVRGEIGVEAWVLFAILFFWQLPHFLAIAWLYREDYARGGFLVLPIVDPDGSSTSRHILANTMALLTMSLMPTLVGLTGSIYFVGALLLGAGFLAAGVLVAIQRSQKSARRLLLASIVYLPILLILMTADKIRF